mgnify:CR=1 FL=1
MHDDDKLKLAREAAENSTPFWEFISRADRLRLVQSALAAINALDPQLVEAVGLLREVLDDLAMVADAKAPDPHIIHELQALCNRVGYGNVMCSASSLWRATLGELAGGEFVAGPCRTTVRNQVNRISAFLAKQGDA